MQFSRDKSRAFKSLGSFKAIILIFIRLYQAIFAYLKPKTCRFYPACSQYAYQAVDNHGALRGSMLSLRRICKCHPFNPGGVDFVPGIETGGKQ